MRARRASKRNNGFWHEHGLSLVAAAILATWIALYFISDEKTHIGAFFGNAIADWTGLLVMVLATKCFYEQGSPESKPDPHPAHQRVLRFLRQHSLTIFLIITGIGWTTLFAKLDSESKWGQVTGNIVSEWTQILGIVLLTKGLLETGSKESKE